ncbi:hypothetical protein [Macrococcus armenti]|uniref:hypothetical protein n=1 Tax=Macrococcus armenti TaxID=2875764 RepID=UPI001CCF7B8A|nr:hypothetical protein [Macrococcus armenti]UBH16389.1 hypothetical protein LAU44_05385 [Macrococcus armenti]UBH18745.1 hypothetical protein LAU39_05395 [Macrococcus armenti]UBH21017.1 hypothetical protein LAU40_05390 [Macrococcus armenti]
MRFREFEDAMYIRGYRVVRENDFIKVIEGQDTIAIISDTKKFCYTLTKNFNEFTDEHQTKLYKFIAEYVATPINERHNQQKYYIVCKHPNYNQNHKYLNRRTYDGVELFLGGKEENSLHQTQFTELEIIELDLLPFIQNPLFERIEVGVEEC